MQRILPDADALESVKTTKKCFPRSWHPPCMSMERLSEPRRNTVRKMLVGALILAAICAGTAFALDPAALNRITFDNATGGRIETIFLSPADSRYWGPDVIGAGYILENGAAVSYYVYAPDTSLGFDIMACDDRGTIFEVRDFRIPDDGDARVSLTPASLKTKARDLSFATVQIQNKTGHQIQYLFVCPGDSAQWGVDLLDEQSIMADGDACSFVLLVGKDKVKYKLLAADEENVEYQFALTIDPRMRKELSVSIEPGDVIKPQ